MFTKTYMFRLARFFRCRCGENNDRWTICPNLHKQEGRFDAWLPRKQFVFESATKNNSFLQHLPVIDGRKYERKCNRTIPFLCYAGIVLGQKQQGGGWIGRCRRDPSTVSPQKVTIFLFFYSIPQMLYLMLYYIYCPIVDLTKF